MQAFESTLTLTSLNDGKKRRLTSTSDNRALFSFMEKRIIHP